MCDSQPCFHKACRPKEEQPLAALWAVYGSALAGHVHARIVGPGQVAASGHFGPPQGIRQQLGCACVLVLHGNNDWRLAVTILRLQACTCE